jgi:hypothetical protein
MFLDKAWEADFPCDFATNAKYGCTGIIINTLMAQSHRTQTEFVATCDAMLAIEG